MKKFLVILLGLLLAGISGTLVFRELGSYAPTPSVTFETAVPATENANHPSSPSPENDGLLMPFGSDINAAVHAKRIEYGDYRTGVIGEQKVLLFFSSSSDPMSVDHDKQLRDRKSHV